MASNRDRFATSSELDRVLHELSDNVSELSSLFSSDGGSEYDPANEAGENYSDDSILNQDMELDGDQDGSTVPNQFGVADDVLENRGRPTLLENDIPNLEDSSQSDSLELDPNVQFIVNCIHNEYQSTEALWTNTQTAPNVIHFIGQESVHIEVNDPETVFSNLFDDALLDKLII